MRTRKLGTTGESLTEIGFGSIMLMNETQSTAGRWVAEAYDLGVRYFDVAPQYGNAQERLGPALQAYRNDVFLSCKTLKRTAADAAADLENSLRLLRTDYVDLYQLHAITTRDDLEAVTAPGGALEAFAAAREAGKVRFIGFSAHDEDIACELLTQFPFTSVLFPVNGVLWHTSGFGRKLVPAARDAGTAVLAIKALAQRPWQEGEDRGGFKSWYKPVESDHDLALLLRFTLEQPVTAAVSPGDMALFRRMCAALEQYAPLSDDEQRELEAYAARFRPLFPKET